MNSVNRESADKDLGGPNLILTFLKVVKSKKRKRKKKICDRDHMWPLNPKVFTAWPFVEEVCCCLVIINIRWLVGVSARSHAKLAYVAFPSLLFPSSWYFIIIHILFPFLIHCWLNSSPPIFSFLSIQNGCRVTGNLYLQNSLKNIRNNTVSWARYVSNLKQRPPQTVRPFRKLVLRWCWILCSR